MTPQLKVMSYISPISLKQINFIIIYEVKASNMTLICMARIVPTFPLAGPSKQ